MVEQQSREHTLRTLINTQDLDDIWLFKVSIEIRVAPYELRQPDWYKHKWNEKWGSIDTTNDYSPNEIVWIRPDGAKPLIDGSDKYDNLKAARFALLGELIENLKSKSELSYVEVGYPDNWNKCIITVNGEKIEKLISADALLGIYEMYDRDKKGKLKLDENKELVVVQLSGYIKILVEKNRLSFF